MKPETREQVMAVAMGQPHRRGNDDPRLESPLGRLCVSESFPVNLYGAGVRYREIVIDARQAIGLANPGYGAGKSGYTEGGDDAAIAKRVERTRKSRDESDNVLRQIKPFLPSLMQNLCVLEMDNNINDIRLLRAGLVALYALYSSGSKKSA